MNDEKLNSLSRYSAPTHVAFVDTSSGKVFLKAAMHASGFGGTKAVEIDEFSSSMLREEVIGFWNHSGIQSFKENYQSQF